MMENKSIKSKRSEDPALAGTKVEEFIINHLDPGA
jgi:hypothetical protein